MTEQIWFILVVWILLLLLSFRVRKSIITSSAGIIGIFMGLTLIPDVIWLGIILVFLNLYVIYTGIFQVKGK